MKVKKQINKIGLTTLVLMLFLGITRVSYGAELADFGNWATQIVTEGVIWLLTKEYQMLVLGIFLGLQAIILAITGTGSIGDVVFNRCGLTTASYFSDFWGGHTYAYGAQSDVLIANVQKFYAIMRGLSIAILLGILLYIGIRMAISTVASEEAKYKKMLFDWAVSLVLVFVLHFIIILTFFVNDVLVDVLSKFEDKPTVIDWAGLAVQAAIPRSRVRRINYLWGISNINISIYSNVYKTYNCIRIFNCNFTINYNYIFSR